MDLITHLKQNPFVLAPMAGITDYAFRNFMKQMGVGIVVSELVSATGIKFKSAKTMELLRFDDKQRPVGLQLFGEDPVQLGEAAKVIEDLGADFVDLNFGCPVPKVVKKGAGSALLKDLNALTGVLKAVRSAVSIPVTIKIRTGWCAQSRNADQVTHIAYNEGMSWVAIHGRTRAAAYTGLADWDYIKQVKAQSPLPVIGNGDIVTAEMAVERLKESDCDGVMIGRGCLKNPSIFLESLSLLRPDVVPDLIEQNMQTVFNNLYASLAAHCAEPILKIQLRKFAAWYSSGYPGSAQFRKSLFQTAAVEDIMSSANDYFSSLQFVKQEDTSQEAFLMGGHG